MLAIIDYGAGNLKSIYNACAYLGCNPTIVKDAEALSGASRVILPGVGNFGDAISKLSSIDGFPGAIREKVSAGVPFLGICLGIQIIFEKSEESPASVGLGIFKGSCRRLEDKYTGDNGEITSLKIPHIGWNNLKILNNNSKILMDITSNDYFYFVHSYYASPAERDIVCAVTPYGIEFPSVIERENIFAVQFHPERSGKCGLKLLKNFLDYN